MGQLAERELLARIHGGDQAALEMLLKAHQGRLYNVCLRMLGNRDDAAEITQDAIIKIIEHIDSYRGDAQLSTWMIRIAMNQSISYLRKRRLRQAVSLEAGYGGDDDDSASPGLALRRRLEDQQEPGPAANVQKQEMLELLRTAIGRLDEQYRAVLVLRDIDQMEYRQVAQVLDVPVGTVKSRLFRARLALREQMEQLESSAVGLRSG